MSLVPYARFVECREQRLARAADLARQDVQRTIEAQALPEGGPDDLGDAEVAIGPQADPAVREHES